MNFGDYVFYGAIIGAVVGLVFGLINYQKTKNRK
jgi:hypothetical protein